MADYDIPFTGLYAPGGSWSPIAAAGRFAAFENWWVKNGVLAVVPGYAQAYTAYQTNTGNSVVFACVYPISGGGAYVYFLSGKQLEKITLNSSGSATAGTVLTTTFLSTTPSGVLSWVTFSNVILIGTGEGLFYIKPSDDSRAEAGLAAPTTAATVAAGSAGLLTGNYAGVYTYVNAFGHESNPSPASNTAALTADQLNWSGVTVGGAGVSKRRFYRTIANGVVYLYDGEDSNTGTTYTSTIADKDLGTVVQEVYDAPPSNIAFVHATPRRVYLGDADGETIWASGVDVFTAEPNWEAYSPDYSFTVPTMGGADTLRAMFTLAEREWAASLKGIFSVDGDPDTGVVVNRVLDEGFYCKTSWVLTDKGLIFLNENKRLKLWDGQSLPVDIGADVQAELTAINHDPYLWWDQKEHRVVLSWRDESLVLDLASMGFTVAGWPWILVVYDEAHDKFFAAEYGDSRLESATGYLAAGAKYATQAVETTDIIPSPGNDTHMRRLAIMLKPLPIVSYVPPTLKVEVAYDGSNRWLTHYVDLTKDFIQETGDSPASKTVYVPLHRRARSVAFKVSTVNNTASLAGVEIFKMTLEVYPDGKEGYKQSWAVDRPSGDAGLPEAS